MDKVIVLSTGKMNVPLCALVLLKQQLTIAEKYERVSDGLNEFLKKLAWKCNLYCLMADVFCTDASVSVLLFQWEKRIGLGL